MAPASRAGIGLGVYKLIGVLDSGSGGLTVLSGLQAALPNQKFIYYADRANCPYGDKSRAVVQQLVQNAVEILFNKGCDLVIIACNTACAVALKKIQRQWLPAHHPDKRVLGIIVPTVESVTGRPWRDFNQRQTSDAENKLVAVFGTLRTVASQVYPFEIHKRCASTRVVQEPIVGLANGIDDAEDDAVLEELIKDAVDSVLEITDGEVPSAALLCCTHYPLVAPMFQKILGEQVKVMDQNNIVSDALVDYLQRHPRFISTGESLAFTNGDETLANHISERFNLSVPKFTAL